MVPPPRAVIRRRDQRTAKKRGDEAHSRCQRHVPWPCDKPTKTAHREDSRSHAEDLVATARTLGKHAERESAQQASINHCGDAKCDLNRGSSPGDVMKRIASPTRAAPHSSVNSFPACSTRVSSFLAPPAGPHEVVRREASEFIDEDRDGMSAANTPAMRSPVRPEGSSCTMKRAKISPGRPNACPSKKAYSPMPTSRKIRNCTMTATPLPISAFWDARRSRHARSCWTINGSAEAMGKTAHASKRKVMSDGRIVRAETALGAEIAAWLERAAQADAAEDGARGTDRGGDEMPSWVVFKTADGFIQGYNAQAAADADHQVIVAKGSPRRAATSTRRCRCSQPSRVRRGGCPANSPPVPATVASRTSRPWRTGPSAAISPPGTRSTARQHEQPGAPPDSHRAAMAHRLPQGCRRSRYRLRKINIEPVLSQIQQAGGFRQFLLRGLEQACQEWTLVSIAHNLTKLATAQARSTPPHHQSAPQPDHLSIPPMPLLGQAPRHPPLAIQELGRFGSPLPNPSLGGAGSRRGTGRLQGRRRDPDDGLSRASSPGGLRNRYPDASIDVRPSQTRCR